MTKVPIVPLADYVVLQQEEVKNKTASGLFLPDGATEKPKTATILALGPQVTDIAVGDHVVYGGYSTTEIKVDGAVYLLVKSENIYAKLA